MRKTARKGNLSRADGVLSLARGAARITYDPAADAAYFSTRKVKNGEAVKTIELQPWLFADLDKKGALLGIEMLFVSKRSAGRSTRAPRATNIPALV